MHVGDTVWRSVPVMVRMGHFSDFKIDHQDISGEILHIDDNGNCAIRWDDGICRVEQAGTFAVDSVNSLHEPEGS